MTHLAEIKATLDMGRAVDECRLRELREYAAMSRAQADRIAEENEKARRDCRPSWNDPCDWAIADGWAKTYTAQADALEEAMKQN